MDTEKVLLNDIRSAVDQLGEKASSIYDSLKHQRIAYYLREIRERCNRLEKEFSNV